MARKSEFISSNERAMSLAALWLALGMMGILLSVGCQPKKPMEQPTNAVAGAASKSQAPPLKLVLVDADLLEAELGLRWQTVSDQKLDVSKMTRDEFEKVDVNTLDVIIYPANFISTLIERGWIAPLPSTVLNKTGGSISTPDEATQGESQRVNGPTWAHRGRSLSQYGGKTMAVPLGAPCWLAIQSGLEISPLLRLYQAIGSNQNTSTISSQLWSEFLDQNEASLASTLADRMAQLHERLQQVSPNEKRSLVARYFWMLSTTEARYRGTFDPYTMQSRMNQPEFSRTARFLQRLAVLEPKTILAEPTVAWESVTQGTASFGIGWPRTDGQQRLDRDTTQSKPKVLPIAWNGADGYLVSLGRRTRQSAHASDLIVWLAAEEQRSAMQALTPLVEPLEIDNDRNVVRDDYREFQTTQRLEAANLSMELTPRFFGSEQFVDLLGDALIDVLRNPDQTESRLAECKKSWDELGATIGKERLRGSLEAASGYSK
jgi:hypothetical protein